MLLAERVSVRKAGAVQDLEWLRNVEPAARGE